MNNSLKRQLVKTFAQMIADLKDLKESEKFLTDFFDKEELEKFTKRLAIAYWIKKGRDGENIKRNLKADQKEINTASNLLKTPGVKLAIKIIEAEEWSNKWLEKIKKYSRT
jgi:uncharacterized protein YerC